MIIDKEYLHKKYDLISSNVPCGQVENLKHEGKLEMLKELIKDLRENP